MRSFTILAALAACQQNTADNFQNPPPVPPDACTPIDDLAGCDQGSVSYACTTGRPDDGDDLLVCSNGTPGVKSSLFCCVPISQYNTDCVPDPALAGCTGIAMGFTCAGGDDPPTTPSDADPSIACSAAIVNADKTRSYCCNTAAIPQTCAIDPMVSCTGAAAGYTCAGTGMPFSSGFTCAVASSAAGDTSYCCVPD